MARLECTPTWQGLNVLRHGKGLNVLRHGKGLTVDRHGKGLAVLRVVREPNRAFRAAAPHSVLAMLKSKSCQRFELTPCRSTVHVGTRPYSATSSTGVFTYLHRFALTHRRPGSNAGGRAAHRCLWHPATGYDVACMLHDCMHVCCMMHACMQMHEHAVMHACSHVCVLHACVVCPHACVLHMHMCCVHVCRMRSM